jgi:hypothetical protein
VGQNLAYGYWLVVKGLWASGPFALSVGRSLVPAVTGRGCCILFCLWSKTLLLCVPKNKNKLKIKKFWPRYAVYVYQRGAKGGRAANIFPCLGKRHALSADIYQVRFWKSLQSVQTTAASWARYNVVQTFLYLLEQCADICLFCYYFWFRNADSFLFAREVWTSLYNTANTPAAPKLKFSKCYYWST